MKVEKRVLNKALRVLVRQNGEPVNISLVKWNLGDIVEVISKVFKNVRKFLLRSAKWGVFGGYSSSFAEATEDKLGSHAQPTIFSSSTILFQPNFAGLLKLPQ